MVVIGAGAAGMMCAAVAGQRGRRVVLIDHAERRAEKIRISGGGRCNFTNRDTPATAYLSKNPHFARSALSRYRPQAFIELVESHGIGWHEKHRGQLFCDDSSQQIIDLLVAECDRGGVQWRQPCSVDSLEAVQGGYRLTLGGETIVGRRVVVATGGLSIPKIGATDFGLRLARRFGLKIVEPMPALVPLVFAGDQWAPLVPLAGLSVQADISADHAHYGTGRFTEDLLFTHRGLSGPAVLQVSSFWQPGRSVGIDLGAAAGLHEAFETARSQGRQTLGGLLASVLPRRLVETFASLHVWPVDRRVAELPGELLDGVLATLRDWQLTPSGTEGWRKAEVMSGGVATDELSQSTFEARRQPGLHFIGEVIDVTGWLGGYNFQWAWASGHACGQAV
ncbi:NAD(P)/FAD-dependent oxidoreductase [soil metagenome]